MATMRYSMYLAKLFLRSLLCLKSDYKISDQMGLIPKNVSEVQYNVKTFIGSGLKSLKEATIDVFLPSGRYLLRSILIENDFNVELNVRGLKESLINIKSKGYV